LPLQKTRKNLLNSQGAIRFISDHIPAHYEQIG
jgi:hypothetical protein